MSNVWNMLIQIGEIKENEGWSIVEEKNDSNHSSIASFENGSSCISYKKTFLTGVKYLVFLLYYQDLVNDSTVSVWC